jgi:hypothetical protein
MAFLSRHRTVLIVLCGIVGLYALVGFVAAPYAVKTYGIPALSERLHHPVLLGDIRINPFTFSVKLSGFEIQEPDETPMFGFEELFVNFEGTSLVRSAYLFDEIRVTFPFGFVHIQPDGKLNLLGLVPAPTEKNEQPAEVPPPDVDAEKKPLPPVDIRLLTIRQGAIEFRDDSKRKPVTIDVVPIEITLQNFSTRRGGENAYAFTAEFGEGEILDWEGDFHLDPLESSGRISLSHVKLNTFWPSIRDRFRFDILSGAVMVDVRYRFDMAAAPVNLQLTDGKIVLSDFRLAAVGERDPVITVPSLELNAIRLDLPKRELGLQTIRMTGADIRAWLAQDGVVNFKTLFAPVGEEASEPPASKPPQPWAVEVHKVEVAKTHIAFEDRSLKTLAALTIDDLQATVSDIHIPFKGPLPVTASLRLNTQGTIETNGSVQVDPLQADLTLTLAHIGLRPFQPYVDRAARVDVKNGELELAGEAHYRSRHESEPMLRYTGHLGVNNLHLADRASQKELLGWTALDVNKIALEVAPTKVKIGEIALREPSARFVIAKDGSTNIARAMQAPDQVAAQPSAPKPAEKTAAKKETSPIPIAIDVVKLSKLSATFVDESIEPTVTTGIQDLSGTIKGLSSKQVAKGDVSLAGKVDKVAPLKIQGQINPLSEDAFTNLKFIFQGVDLTAVSPYAGKYAGYPIAKGKLSLDLKYQVSKKQLVGENKVLVDQFTFGEKTDSPDATGLPVRLAVGLLQDRHGRIDIDMPVRGDLNEPDFRYGKVVLNALVNVITKVATSPFAALGGLVGGGGEDLQFIEFQAGSGELENAEQQKVSSIANALQQRPALLVEIIGAADPQVDRDALALKKMNEEVRRRFTKGGTKNADAVPSQEREFELLSDLFAEKKGKQPTKREEMPGGKAVERVLTADELRQQLIPAMSVDESELRSLAQDRAKAIREQLIQQGKLPEERVFLVEVELEGSEGKRVRTHLNLTGS